MAQSYDFDVVQISDRQFCYDQNQNLAMDADEIITIESGLSEAQRDQAVLAGILRVYANRFNVCFHSGISWVENRWTQVQQNGSVRYFANWDDYQNVGQVLTSAFDPHKKTGLNSAQVKTLRLAIQQKLADEIKNLQAVIARLQLTANHPYVKLLASLIEIARIFAKVRLEIVRSEGYFNARYSSETNTMFLPLADLTVHAFDAEEVAGIVEFCLVETIHELDHALTDEIYYRGWMDAEIVYVYADQSECVVRNAETSGVMFSDDPRAKTGYQFKLDFSRTKANVVYTYDSKAENYRNYPVLASEQTSCIPDEFFSSRLANEAHAFLVQGRYLLFQYHQRGMITDAEIQALDTSQPKEEDIAKLAELIRVRVFDTRGMYKFLNFYQDHLMHYLGNGKDLGDGWREANGTYEHDIQDYYERNYSYITDLERNPPGCHPPQLAR